MLLGAYLFYSFFLVTHGGLREVQKHLEAMTAGDLTTHPNPWGNDEAARLMGSLADMQGSLRNIVDAVRGSSESIVSASSEIASASMDLSARTEQTASNLEQSASSMEEIPSTVRQTADNVRQAEKIIAERQFPVFTRKIRNRRNFRQEIFNAGFQKPLIRFCACST